MLISWIHFSLSQDLFNPNNLKKADYNWAISKTIKQQMISLEISSNKIQLIFNPVRHQPLLNLPKDKHNIRLVYIGRIMFDGQKNLHFLLRTIKGISNIKVDFFGTGNDLNKCKDYCKRNKIENKVIWHGWKKDPWGSLSV